MRNEWRHIAMVFCMGMLLVLGGCADDGTDGTGNQRMHTLQLSLGTTSFRLDEDVTRATLPDKYEEYDHDHALSPITQILGYMTSAAADNREEVPCLFTHTATEDETPVHTWTTKVALTDGNYFLYGFLPREDVASSVNIAPYNNDYANGAVLTFNDLNAVTPYDICIIVGVKGYDTTPPADMSGRLGQFGYNPSAEGENLYLLADHIYGGMEIQMKINETYNNLRTIKLNSIKLMASKKTQAVETGKATITLRPNSSSPMTVEFNTYKYGNDEKAAVLYDSKDDVNETKSILETEYKSFLACMCPNTNLEYTLETNYNVYDTKGNLVRENQTAKNAITLKTYIPAGKKRLVQIEVNPTYLYVLSEPDLDNPTFNIVEN